MEFVADRVTRRAPAATVEGVRIAMRSGSLSSEKSRRELGYTPHTIEHATKSLRPLWAKARQPHQNHEPLIHRHIL
jgi:hypothetical protein